MIAILASLLVAPVAVAGDEPPPQVFVPADAWQSEALNIAEMGTLNLERPVRSCDGYPMRRPAPKPVIVPATDPVKTLDELAALNPPTLHGIDVTEVAIADMPLIEEIVESYELEHRWWVEEMPVMAEWLTKLPNLRLDSQGRVVMQNVQANEVSVILDGAWLPGTTLTSAKGGSAKITPIQAAPFGLH